MNIVRDLPLRLNQHVDRLELLRLRQASIQIATLNRHTPIQRTNLISPPLTRLHRRSISRLIVPVIIVFFTLDLRLLFNL